MSEYDDTNRGALFKNDRKEKDTHPDYKGSLNVGGVDHWLDAWLKKDKNGKTYMSVLVKPKESRQETRQAPRTRNQNDDSIPF